MREKSYGRIINTGSSAGIYSIGAGGRANYAAVKSGLYGMTMSLAKEGEKRNIKTNCVAPFAYTRMSSWGIPDSKKKFYEKVMSPEYVAPFVAYLVHESQTENGGLFEVGAGYIARQRWNRSNGQYFDVDEICPENIAAGWDKVNDYSDGGNFPTDNKSIKVTMMAHLEKTEAKRQAKL
jgi:NAD(P)-dependent dehydrogenase (short-subunit alcohol dehydrogenase family)